jgi:hypothetical protein
MTPEPTTPSSASGHSAPRPQIAPFCAHIQSKKSFFLRRPPNSEAELLDASQSCWCRQTMQSVGPDGAIVDPEDCRSGRGCYESVL